MPAFLALLFELAELEHDHALRGRVNDERTAENQEPSQRHDDERRQDAEKHLQRTGQEIHARLELAFPGPPDAVCFSSSAMSGAPYFFSAANASDVPFRTSNGADSVLRISVDFEDRIFFMA